MCIHIVNVDAANTVEDGSVTDTDDGPNEVVYCGIACLCSVADCDEVVQDEMAVSCTVVVDGEVGHCAMADCDEGVHLGMVVSYTYADDEDDHCGKEGSCTVVVGREVVHHTCVAAVGFYLFFWKDDFY